jgi:hypothetical protein
MVRHALCGAAFAALSVTSAYSDIIIRRDPGGQIGHYLHAAERIRDSGERVIVDGSCLSACTLLLAVVPRERVCVTERAVLGYHAAWVPGANGEHVTSTSATRMMWDIYPGNVRRALARRGGLSRKMIFMRGREVAALYPRCRAPADFAADSERRVRAERRSSRNRLTTNTRQRHSGYRADLTQ